MTQHAECLASEVGIRPGRVLPVRYVFVLRVLLEPHRAERLEFLVVQHDLADAHEFRVHRRLLVLRGLVVAPERQARRAGDLDSDTNMLPSAPNNARRRRLPHPQVRVLLFHAPEVLYLGCGGCPGL